MHLSYGYAAHVIDRQNRCPPIPIREEMPWLVRHEPGVAQPQQIVSAGITLTVT